MPIKLDDLMAAPGFAPRDWQSAAPDKAWSSKPPVGPSEDLERIAALPRRPQPEVEVLQAMVALITARYARPPRLCRCRELDPNRKACITSLLPVQAWALFEIGLVGGLVGPIGVGHGKTILDLLTPLAMPNCKTACLLVPPRLCAQLIGDYELLAEHFRVPSLVVHGSVEYLAHVPDAPVLHVLPYTRLSRADATVWLEALSPDTVIADETHKLRHADTATTSRVLRYFRGHTDARFACWTGSITDTSIRDYAHLSALALRHSSPLPIDPETVEDWARAIDPSDFPAPPGALLDLCEPGEHIYDGFHRRLTETLGVVATTASAVDTELVIDERPAPAIPPAVADALNNLRATWTRPDGEEFIEALPMVQCAHQLASGFYYRWIFPRGESVATIEEWLAARKEWHRELRDKLRDRREHLDSPLLCARAAMRAWGDETITPPAPGEPELPLWHARTWKRWRDVRHTVQPETEAVRLHDYLARDAAQWALTTRGIVWYQHGAFGRWVAELSGLPLHEGGPDAAARIKAERGDRSIVASIKAHGTGVDGLQRIFSAQLIGNPPSSASDWEQLLGRLHRIGQEASLVSALFYRHTPELARHVDQALARALYVARTMGSAQKLRAGFRLE